MTKRTRNFVLATLGGLCLAVAGAAGAADGWGVLVAKDTGTLTLQTGVVLQVDDQTRITDREGNALSLMELVPARRVGAGLEVTGESQLRWEGQPSGDQQIDASRVVVWGEEIR